MPILFGLALLLNAQVDTGTIRGTVRDNTGAVVPEAKVTLRERGHIVNPDGETQRERHLLTITTVRRILPRTPIPGSRMVLNVAIFRLLVEIHAQAAFSRLLQTGFKPVVVEVSIRLFKPRGMQ